MRTAPPILYARTPRGDIAYQVAGDGPVDLLYINGWGRSIEALWDYEPVAEPLRRLMRFSRLIIFDRRGTGVSSALPTSAPPSWEDWADDVISVLDHAGIASKIALFAAIDACYAALLFSASHPQRVRALVLGHGAARYRVAPDYPFGLSDARIEQLARFFEDNWGTERIQSLANPSHVNDPGYLEWSGRMNRIACSPSEAVAAFRYFMNADVRSVLDTIHAPTLILHRTGFGLLSPDHAQYLATHIQGARLELLPGSDALILRPGDEKVLGLVEEFLTGTRQIVTDDRVLATVLFTDIARSTELAAQMGDARWRDIQRKHHEIVRNELAHFRGREVDTAGDGFLASFDGPARALRCAQAVQNELRQKLQIEIRAGLHTGECERLGDKLSGLAVHIGARVMATAEPGEILASATVKDLVTGSGLAFRAAGVHQLKGVPGDWPLFALDG